MKTRITALILIAITTASNAQQADQLRKKHFNLHSQVALDGYDPVSYFEGDPQEGSDRFSYTHESVKYYFASEVTRTRFKANPEKYEPAYGGWCAYAMGATGEKVKVDAETYKIVNGKLLLFYNFWGNNTLEDWNKAEERLKKTADANWKNTFR